MTKKLDPPTAPSSDEDDVETSEDDSSSSEEDEPIKSLPATTAAAPAKSTAVSAATPAKSTSVSAAAPSKSTAVSAAADSDSGSESETDSDSESTDPPKSGSGKTIASKKKDDPSSSTATLALPAVKSGAKRAASEAATTSTKRVKKDEESVKKPALFQRLWSDDDEISMLQGMIDYHADTGKSPSADTNAFYEFQKKSISFEVSKSQFSDKVRSLRKKYRAKEGKDEPRFVKAHDKKAFELSKFIWGPKGIALDSNAKSNGVSKKSASKTKEKLDSVKQDLAFVGVSSTNGDDWFEKSSLARMIAGSGIDEYYVRQKWSSFTLETKKIVEEKFQLMQAKELEAMLDKSVRLTDLTSYFVDASKN
ncbi:putative protein [Arabidopsis thaliana]|jgi:hypothetical protein|uniref:Probable transcription factor At4g00390 n=1 Tax=Arabidopsis thaliana TaxID=3702 RepID=STKLP_ARATH|nr:DNA-binding storekeeper protein-related transcriptional regulator [Arabidopsis thaliana]O23063.1 RecName: Full=Probable transcription factor At4g00390; AltName: Full=Storekeeper-like protein At4g00390 [Arabidopsis thaliana]AAB62828.1 A_IG005I10.6 gene product [Arabidopsis thaliana]AAF02786.1 F5I10.6 gene product [Arabidopsis thaliana]ABE66038.1 unknown [Arabidopsis thaliana]AEE81872.1 DNA-binding storekeeper protein-related transcriptional regulator [Arabidopsis thaliana]CAB80797.1 putativ|eukprot:NP_191949.1 DNA-binding storekeeper protein-related transcriptional regulator [Arabidopsis thaliana]